MLLIQIMCLTVLFHNLLPFQPPKQQRQSTERTPNTIDNKAIVWFITLPTVQMCWWISSWAEFANISDGSHVLHMLCFFLIKKVKLTHTRLSSVEFRSWSRFLAVSLQVTWVINPAVGCHYLPPGLQLPPQPLRGLLPVSLLGEQRHNRCEQFA